ncbi:hypothetical protein HYDPIDRAFT_127764 [Hydnomerulius pinastri MD-312]|nr:hypothetical protein HYDPIDRAFT_127764 [Hydnomerulius pinastri MD-312]
MGKNKNKDEIPNPNSVSNRDILQRLNFLYQASVLLNGIAPNALPVDLTHDISSSPQSNDAESSKQVGRVAKKAQKIVSTSELSRSYVDTMKIVGQKTNVKMDPSVKRTICKGCSLPLVPGLSATVRIKNSTSHSHLVSYTCHSCRTERRIPAPPVLHAEPLLDEEIEDAEGEASGSTALAASAAGPVRNGRHRKKKKPPFPRLPPHFARDVGHVVFRGNDKLS